MVYTCTINEPKLLYIFLIEPPISPSNVKVEKIESGTKIAVTWDLLTPEQAWGFVANYTVSYQMHKEGKVNKRQIIEKTVPGTQNSLVIEDIDPKEEYTVVVWASTKTGMGKHSEPASTTKSTFIV